MAILQFAHCSLTFSVKPQAHGSTGESLFGAPTGTYILGTGVFAVYIRTLVLRNHKLYSTARYSVNLPERQGGFLSD